MSGRSQATVTGSAHHRLGSAKLSLVLEVGAGVVMVAVLWLTVPTPSMDALLLQLFLAGAAVVGLLIRRRLPWVATVTVSLATAIGWWFAVTGDPFLIAAFCLFLAAERYGSRQFPWWLGVGVVVLLLSVLTVSSEGIEGRLRGTIIGMAVLSVAWVMGVRSARAREALLGHTRAEERMRLSRDVHDVLAHGLGTIGVRAGVMAHVESVPAEELRNTLKEIEKDSRGALSELRVLMREQRTPTADGRVPTAPLSALVADVAHAAESAGVNTTIRIDENAELASVSTRTTAHRIIQEAVTNVVRHARASSCTIRVGVENARLVLEVHDDGRGTGAKTHEGLGLAGMRERVELIHGSIFVGNAESGFVVRADLPVDGGGEGTYW